MVSFYHGDEMMNDPYVTAFGKGIRTACIFCILYSLVIFSAETAGVFMTGCEGGGLSVEPFAAVVLALLFFPAEKRRLKSCDSTDRKDHTSGFMLMAFPLALANSYAAKFIFEWFIYPDSVMEYPYSSVHFVLFGAGYFAMSAAAVMIRIITALILHRIRKDRF